MKQFVILLTCLILSCTSNTDKETKTLIVNSFKTPCTGVAPMSCLQVKESPEDSQWTNFYNQIEGFDYEPGFLYTIEVSVENIPEDQIVADASSLKYTLINVINKVLDKRLSINDIWVLETIEGKPVTKTFERLPYLEVLLSSNKYLGNDGCNNFNGNLEVIEEELIVFGSHVSAEIACSNQELSFKFVENLRKANKYKTEKGILTLFKGSNVLLTFKKTD
ncbi:DUF4377 domain-containing protein [uncultured Algibacter sp.]|uniref:DUF4377 domain-containing protein n=1 Tax=uncultured Algibacter sp. TaxID=298659 RepID=UPI002603379C|nr:DUF4377 domain-containing protein [uncultured Algibacter sp.]